MKKWTQLIGFFDSIQPNAHHLKISYRFPIRLNEIRLEFGHSFSCFSISFLGWKMFVQNHFPQSGKCHSDSRWGLLLFFGKHFHISSALLPVSSGCLLCSPNPRNSLGANVLKSNALFLLAIHTKLVCWNLLHCLAASLVPLVNFYCHWDIACKIVPRIKYAKCEYEQQHSLAKNSRHDSWEYHEYYEYSPKSRY